MSQLTNDVYRIAEGRTAPDWGGGGGGCFADNIWRRLMKGNITSQA